MWNEIVALYLTVLLECMYQLGARTHDAVI